MMKNRKQTGGLENFDQRAEELCIREFNIHKEKKYGRLKGRSCAVGTKQRTSHAKKNQLVS